MKAFAKDWKAKHVNIMCDNTTAVCYIDNMGGSVSKACNQLAYEFGDGARLVTFG